jgi:hypothetical protein
MFLRTEPASMRSITIALRPFLVRVFGVGAHPQSDCPGAANMKNWQIAALTGADAGAPGVVNG